MKRGVGGWLLVATAFIACPCHLPLTLGLLVGLAGTGALGGFLSSHTGLVYGIAAGYFIVGVGTGMYVWSRKGVCETDSVPPGKRQGAERAGW